MPPQRGPSLPPVYPHRTSRVDMLVQNFAQFAQEMTIPEPVQEPPALVLSCFARATADRLGVLLSNQQRPVLGLSCERSLVWN